MAAKGIVPKKINAARIREDIIKASEKQGITVANDYKKITKAWTGDKPTFPIKTTIKNDDLITSIIASGGFGAQKLVWLDDGTKKNYPIEAKKSSTLAFQSGYKAKTKARTIGSTGGGSFGSTVFKKKVIHPGIDKREFSLTIADNIQPQYTKSISAKVI